MLVALARVVQPRHVGARADVGSSCGGRTARETADFDLCHLCTPVGELRRSQSMALGERTFFSADATPSRGERTRADEFRARVDGTHLGEVVVVYLPSAVSTARRSCRRARAVQLVELVVPTGTDPKFSTTCARGATRETLQTHGMLSDPSNPGSPPCVRARTDLVAMSRVGDLVTLWSVRVSSERVDWQVHLGRRVRPEAAQEST